MDATLGFILIFVLAVLLVALGIGLSRRAQRKDRIPGETRPAPAGPITDTKPAAAPEGAERAAAAGVAEPETEPSEEAPPVRLRDRLGKTRAAFAKLRGRRIDDETWEDLEDTLLLADVGMPTTERILGDVRERAKTEKTSDTDALMGLLHTELVALLTSSRWRRQDPHAHDRRR